MFAKGMECMMKANRKKIVNVAIGILSCCGIILIVGVCLLRKIQIGVKDVLNVVPI